MDSVDAVKPWLQTLSRRLHLTDRHRLEPHNIKVESSHPEDWWIQVQHGSLDMCPRCMTDHGADSQDPFHIKRMKKLREALLLTVLLREIDYDAWLQELKQTCGLILPSSVNEPNERRLKPKFSLTLQGGWTSHANVWKEQMLPFFDSSVTSLDPGFLLAFEQLAKLTGGEKPSLVVPIRLLFSHVAITLHEQVEDLRKVSETIQAIQRIKSDETESVRFRLDGVELYLRRYELHPLVLQELWQLADTGVKIHFLSLPGRLEGPVNDALLREWTRLSGALFRSTRDDSLHIQRLELPPVYTTDPFSATWLSALSDTQNIESLRIDGRFPAAGLPAFSHDSFWVELIRCLASPSDQSSIRALHLDGFGALAVSVVGSIADLSAVSGDTGLRSLVIQPDSKVSETVGDTAPPQVWIPVFLRHLGKSLTDLALDGVSVDGPCLERALASCPRLQSLRLSGARLSSMEVLRRAYDSGMPLMSLDLRESAISADKLEQFLNHTTSEASPIHRKLRSLRIADSSDTQFTISTLASFEKALASGSSISHLHIVKAMTDFTMPTKPLWSDRLAKFDGTTMSIKKAPLPTSSKLAFVDALRRMNAAGLAPDLTTDTILEILEFAAMPSRRTVRVEHDATMWRDVLI